jgi:acylglycerol lipase
MQKEDIIEFNLINDDIKLNILTHDIDIIDRVAIHIHGLGSHFQFIYECTNEFHNRINYLIKQNIKSYAIELRGHGKSSGINGFVKSFDEYISDLHVLICYVEKRHKNIPIYLIGESMGGAVCIKYSVLYPNTIKGIILLAPMCGIPKLLQPSKYLIGFLIVTSYVLPHSKLLYYSSQTSCRHVEYFEEKMKNKYQYIGLLRLGTARECHYIMTWLNNNTKHFNTPVIIFHATNDTITNIETSKTFLEQCNSYNKKLVEIEDSHHSVLVPINNDDMRPHNNMEHIVKWITMI